MTKPKKPSFSLTALPWKNRPPAAGKKTSSLQRLRLPLRRYFLASLGIAASAVGLAICVSFLAVVYAEGAPTPSGRPNVEVSSAAIAAFSLAGESEPWTASHAPRPPQSGASVLREGRVSGVNITFYDCLAQGFCGNMANGRPVYEGAAACSWDMTLGTRFRIVGDPTARVYICEDRGLLSATWVDVFWHDPVDGWLWQAQVGRFASIEIVEAPAP